jgi:DNA-binding transcriptional ArsR family regulator
MSADAAAAAGPAMIFAALGDPLRLRLAASLSGEGRSIAALSAGLPVTRQAVTKHLHVLESAGLAQAERAGREVLWRARPEGLAAARGLLDAVAARWDQTLARLKAHVEGG